MSTDAGAGGGSADVSAVDEYEDMQERLDDIIDEILRKLTGDGRIRDVEREKIRVQLAQAGIRAIDTRRKVVNDRTKARLDEELQDLTDGEDLGP